MYRQVARQQEAQLHFAMGRQVALRVGYPSELLDAIPAEALASFAGVGYRLDLARLAPGERVLDLGSGSGTDVFAAAVQVGAAGPRGSYLRTLEAAGFRVGEIRTNDYEFISERALDACNTYGVESISLAAVREDAILR